VADPRGPVRQFEEATGGASASADGASAVDEAAE